MSEPINLEKHRQTITERLHAIKKEIEAQSEGRENLVNFIMLTNELVENLKTQVEYMKADSTLFQKLILAGIRLSNSWEDFQKRSSELE